MLSGRPIVRFVLLTLTYFFLAALLIPRGSYAPRFQAAATLMFQLVPSDLTAKLSPVNEPGSLNDTRLHVGRQSGRFPGGMSFEARRHGFVPTALLVSLILATPVPWRRRGSALAIGLVAIHGFLALRLWVTALLGLSVVRMDGQRLLPLSRFLTDAVALVDKLLSDDLHITFVVPVLVWLLVTVRPDDLSALTASVGGKRHPTTRGRQHGASGLGDSGVGPL